MSECQFCARLCATNRARKHSYGSYSTGACEFTILPDRNSPPPAASSVYEANKEITSSEQHIMCVNHPHLTIRRPRRSRLDAMQ